MRWNVRPPLLFLFLQGLPPMQTLGSHCLFGDPKQRWVWGGQFVYCLSVPRWGGGVCFLSGGAPGEEGNLLSCRAPWPINTLLSFLIL